MFQPFWIVHDFNAWTRGCDVHNCFQLHVLVDQASNFHVCTHEIPGSFTFFVYVERIKELGDGVRSVQIIPPGLIVVY